MRKLTVELFDDGSEVFIMANNRITPAIVRGVRITAHADSAPVILKEYLLEVRHEDCDAEKWYNSVDVFENRETLIAHL